MLYFLWLIIFYIFGLYDLHLIKTNISFYTRAIGAISVNLIMGMLFFYTIPFFKIAPKTNLIINVLIFGFLFLNWRKFYYSLFSNYFLNRATIIGKGFWVEKLKKEISERPYLGYKLIPVYLGKELIPQIKEHNIDTVIFTENFESDPKILKALYSYSSSQVDFLDLVGAYELITEKIPVSIISQSWFIENIKKEERILYNKIKRFADLILSSFLLILTLPFWPFIAILIKLEDKGPIFYCQKRIGKDKKSFTLYKFRSMKVRAEKEKAVWAEKEDKRITNIGQFLRRTHIDEIPQMINIIKGNISLVGPRPERPELIEELKKEIPYYHSRHTIKPGFTGWAQIKFRYGRSVMDSKEKFGYDLYYLKNRNFLLDIGILLKTFQLFFRKE